VWDYLRSNAYHRFNELGLDPAGRIWLRPASGPESGRRFEPRSLPREEDVRTIDERLAARKLVLQSGEAVSLAIEIDPRTPVKNYTRRIEAILRKKLAERGIRVEAGQAKVLRARFEQIDGSLVANKEVYYRKAGVITDHHVVSVPIHNISMEIAIEEAGQTPWRLTRKCSRVSVSPNDDITNLECRDDPHYCVDAEPWFRLARWLKAWPWPSELREQVPPPLGKSEIK
jgi:hypothetical protein